jgi:methylmalonyl-CoA/ethylmalonyl-CoA epimerase
VDDIQARIDALKAGGLRMIDDHPRGGAHHTQIAFLHPKSSQGILVEICEVRK